MNIHERNIEFIGIVCVLPSVNLSRLYDFKTKRTPKHLRPYASIRRRISISPNTTSLSRPRTVNPKRLRLINHVTSCVQLQIS